MAINKQGMHLRSIYHEENPKVLNPQMQNLSMHRTPTCIVKPTSSPDCKRCQHCTWTRSRQETGGGTHTDTGVVQSLVTQYVLQTSTPSAC
jgi:hypothetical protein